MVWILLLGLSLRLISLNQSLWLDEAFQYKATALFSLKQLLTVYLPGDFNPPLSYLVNFFVGKLFGYSEIILRLPSVIFGLLTIWLVSKLSKKNLWPALLLATSGLHIYYSQEARMYSLACMAVVASFYFFQKKRWFWYAIFSLMAIYSHYLTVFIFPAQLLLTKRKDLKNLVISWVIIALGFLPWLPIFFKQLSAGQTTAGTGWGNVVGGLSLKALMLIPIKFLIGRIAPANDQLYLLIIIIPLLLTAWVLYKSTLSYKKNLFFLSWLLIPLFLIVLVSFKLPVLAYFRLLFLLPAFYLLITKVASKKILIAFLVINLISSAVYLFNPAFHREDWKSLTKTLSQVNQPTVIIPAVNAALKYYSPLGNILTTETVPEENFWYIPYAEPIFDPQLQFRSQVITAGFKESSVQNFRGNLTLIQYTQ